MPLQLVRVHGLPPECAKAFEWLSTTCKASDAYLTDVIFTTSDLGCFMKAEGTISLNERR